MKKTLSILLTLLLLICIVPLAPVAATDDNDLFRLSGTCGNNITWTLEDGVLTVSGEGAIEEQQRYETETVDKWNYETEQFEVEDRSYPIGYYPWNDLIPAMSKQFFETKADILQWLSSGLDGVEDFMLLSANIAHTLVIEEGVTAVPQGAFQRFYFKNIYLPSSLQTVGECAFYLGFTDNIYVKNPNLDFADGATLLGLPGAQNELPAWMTSAQTVLNNMADMYIDEFKNIGILDEYARGELAKAAALMDGYGDADYYDYVMQPWAKYGIETPQALAAWIVGLFNDQLGTSYTSVDDILVKAPVCSCEMCDHKTALECKRAGCDCCDCKNGTYHPVEIGPKTLYVFTDDFYTTFNEFPYTPSGNVAAYEDITNISGYTFGDAPQTEEYNSSGDVIGYIPLVPFPWVTVHGYAGSTAQFAAETSGVNFVPLAFGGTYGDITWSLEDGVLTVGGRGEIVPATRVVPYEAAPGEVSEWNEELGDYDPAPTTQTEEYFPWNEAFDLAVGGEIGVPGFQFEEPFIELGLADAAEVLQAMLSTVHTIVIGEGITGIRDYETFNMFLPQTVVLPSTFGSSPTAQYFMEEGALDCSFVQDIYINNPQVDMDRLHIELSGFQGESSPFASADDLVDNAQELFRASYRSEGFYTITGFLYEIFCLKNGYAFELTGDEMTEDEVLAKLDESVARWNELAKTNYTTVDELVSAIIELMNGQFCMSFTTLDEMFVGPPIPESDGAVFPRQSAALTEAWNAYAQTEIEPYVQAIYGETMFGSYFLGNAPVDLFDSNNEPHDVPLVPSPWITIHGYAGSTAETAAATSGVNFAPLCPTDYTHTVTEKAEVPATCTEAGHTAGWYCADCEQYLTGEAVGATGHAHTRTVAATEPTRRVHGFTEGVFCDDCQTYISGHEVIHNQLGSRHVVKPATETEEGEVEIVCTVCGETGLYALDKLEPEPEQGDSDSSGNPVLDFFRQLANGIMSFFLRLIKWLGKK